MSKNIVLIFLISFNFSIYSQIKQTIKQNRAALVGVKSKKDFTELHWFEPVYNGYPLCKKTIKKLKKYAHSFKIKAFMAIWCHDSRREIPRLYKILDAIDFNMDNLEVIAVDRSKKTPNNLQKGFNISRTPTFIFFKNGKEIGRYVELPRKSLEKDMLRIVSGKPYKHAYQKE